MLTTSFKELLHGIGTLFRAKLLAKFSTKRHIENALDTLKQVDLISSSIYIDKGFSESDRCAMLVPYDSKRQLVIRELNRVSPRHYRVFILGFHKSSKCPSSDSVAMLDTLTNIWYASVLSYAPIDRYTRSCQSTIVAKVSKVKRKLVGLQVTWYVHLWLEAQVENAIYLLPKVKGSLLLKLQMMGRLLSFYSV